MKMLPILNVTENAARNFFTIESQYASQTKYGHVHKYFICMSRHMRRATLFGWNNGQIDERTVWIAHWIKTLVKLV